jgi:DNA phosphorothioation-dependent restriction protein DptG
MSLSLGVFLLTNLSPYLSYYYCLHIILLLHSLSTNHKRTQPCYFSLLYKPAAQKVKMVMKNSSTKSYRLYVALIAVPVVL